MSDRIDTRLWVANLYNRLESAGQCHHPDREEGDGVQRIVHLVVAGLILVVLLGASIGGEAQQGAGAQTIPTSGAH
jgi:hypothetical protein